MESHGADTLAQKVSSAVMAATVSMERPFALNQAILACRPGGNVSMPGVFAGPVGPVMLGLLMNKGLTLKTGQTHMVRYMKPLMERIQKGEIDPSFIISHRSTIAGGWAGAVRGLPGQDGQLHQGGVQATRLVEQGEPINGSSSFSA